MASEFATTSTLVDVPWIVSVDDHVIEPPRLWLDHIPDVIDDVGDVATRDHHATRQLTHRQTFWFTFELGHQVKAGQGDFKLFAQTLANGVFDACGARQQTEPQAQRGMVIRTGPNFHIGHLL